MTESVEELRSRLGALHGAAHDYTQPINLVDHAHRDFVEALLDAWPTIDAMLARLALRLHDEAVTHRNQP